MKTRKIGKKLVLSKQTLANLSVEGMKEVRGGDIRTLRSICYTICCR